MATYDLTYLNNEQTQYPQHSQYQQVATVERPQLNKYEEIMQRKMQRDFENFLIASDGAKVEQRVRELERQGVITVNWNKVDNAQTSSTSYDQSELSPSAIKTAKTFLLGICFGIGIMLLLL